MPMDKMEAHLRQQLSAMMDGELTSDEARFLFRRLQHDHELAGCWERWQVCSVVLRGQGEALLPADFSRRVARAVESEAAHAAHSGEQAAATGTHPRRWAWWGGGALAASLALLVVAPRQGSGPAPAAADDVRVAAAATTSPVPATPAPQPSAPPDASHSPATPPAAVALTTALAVAEAPRRIAARRSRASGHGSSHASTPAPRMLEAADDGQHVATAEPLKLPNRANPFAPRQEEALPAHPWPRAVLPGGNTGAFTASYSTGSSGAFYPFEPRNLPMPEAQAAAGDGQR